MKKLLPLLLMPLLVSAPTMYVSESIILVRAIPEKDVYRDIIDVFIPGVLARGRISLYGLKKCSDLVEGAVEPHNLVNFLAAAHSKSDNNKALIRQYLSVLKNNGCSFEAVDLGGLPALHGAILFNDYELVQFFVKNGASLKSKINRPGKKSHEKNALEFTHLLQEVESNVNRMPIIEYLDGQI